MTTKYFCNVSNLDELKSAYRRAAMANHPDRGGSEEAMKEINADYTKMFDILKDAHNMRAENPDNHTRPTTEAPEEFIAIIEALLHMDGLTVELCGSWLWIGGETRAHKEALKAAGCRWSNNKKLWYWHHAEDGSHWHRGNKSMAQIRHKYGSQTFTSGTAGDPLPA